MEPSTAQLLLLPVLSLLSGAGGATGGVPTPNTRPALAAPLQVFVLVGQSNMVGHGLFEARNASTGRYLNGTLGWLAEDPRTRAEFAKLKTRGSSAEGVVWAHRADVLVINDVNSINDTTLLAAGSRSRTGAVAGYLRPGWGGDSGSVGPELGFGWTVGDSIAPPALLLKVAWGGKSLGADFRPPSSGNVGPYYTRMVAKVRHYLANLKSVLPPGSVAAGYMYELSGFVWQQGWNDGCNITLGKQYALNLANLIRDVRREFHDLPQKQPLPFVIGVSGMGCCTSGQCAPQCRPGDCVDDPDDPTETTNSCETTLADYVIPAQLAVANATLYPEFAGSVATAETRHFFRPHQYSPGPQIYHWYNNCESYWLLGKAMAKTMLQLLGPLPSPPSPPPLPPVPAPAGQGGVVLYQQGGNGTLRLSLANFSANRNMPGSPRAWDACAGPSGVAHFDNGEAVWAHGTALGEIRVTGSWVVRLSTLCCFHYSYPSCGDRSQNITAADGPVGFMGNYVELVSHKPEVYQRPLKTDALRLVFSPPVPATKASALEHNHSIVAGEEVYFNNGMPPARSFRPLAPQVLDDGTQVRASIVCFAGDHTPVWSHSDVPSSIVAHKSWDGGKTWNYTATIAAAKDFPWSGEGFNECATAVASDDRSIVTAIRTGAGDYEPGAACMGYFDYHSSRSTDGGYSWSHPEPIVGAGSCSPNLIRVGNSLILGGGRMCGNATSGVFLWLNEDGMGDAAAFEPWSLSYWYNTLQTNASAPRFDNGINASCRTEDSGMISVKMLDNTTGSVTFDVDPNHHDVRVTMNFSLVRSEASGDRAAMRVSGPPNHGPGSIPLGRDKQDCVSVLGDPVAPTIINSTAVLPTALTQEPQERTPRSSYRYDEEGERSERSNEAVPIPAITRVCANRTIKATRHAPAHEICDNLTSFPTDGALAPIILIGSNFSWSGRNASAGGPTCRIDPYHGGSIHVRKGENVNAFDIAINYVTFPATVHNDTHASCTPLPVLADGPGLLRLSVDNATWRGISGEAGLEVEYFSLVVLAVSKRPYINEDVGHLFVRTNCLAQGETVGHDLCQAAVHVNATLQAVRMTWSWQMIPGDRALPFNMSQLPSNVHNDLDVTIVFGEYVIHRLVRFMRVTTTTDVTHAVQVDHWTKTLSVGGKLFLGSGYYFGSYGPADLLKLSGELPELVARGVNMGVMLTLPGSNSSVQRVFFDAAERSGFKVIWPLFFMTSLDANQTKQVKAMSQEPSLLGYYIADDGCKAHGWISLLAQGYNDLKQIDPLHATFGSVNCDSPWLFSDKPSFLPPNASATKSVWLGAGQPRTQLSLEVPLLENYGHLSGQMDTGRWAGGPKRDGDFRHGIPFTPIGNCLSPSEMPASTFSAGLWMGVVLAEVYYSAGWVAVPFVNMSNWTSAIGQYSHQQQAFGPAHLTRFGNTRLDVALTPNTTLRGKAWYDADQSCAFVAVVQAGGGSTPLSFTATVLKAFNHRLVFGTVNATISANEAKVLKVTTGPPPSPPPCSPHCAPPPAPPGPGGSGGTCASGAEGATLSVGCASGYVIASVVFADYGSVTGHCPGMSAGTCGTNVLAEAKTACVGQSACSVHCSHSGTGCVEGKGKNCGCGFTSGSAKTPGKFLPIPDPCPGKKKTQGLEVTCNTTASALGVPVQPLKTDDLTVDASASGSFIISTNGKPAFTHSPDDAWLKCAACVVGDPAGPTITGLAPLTLSAHRTFNGSDARGAFAAHEWTWEFVEAFPLDPFGCNPRRWIHTLWAYSSALWFAQDLPEGVDQQSNCECGGKQACDCSGSSSWPSLRPAAGRDFGAYLWQGDFTGNEAGQGVRFNSSTSLGGMAPSPVALFERGFTSGTFVISPSGDARSAMGSRLFSGKMNRSKCDQKGAGCRQAMDLAAPVLNFGGLSCSECPQSAIPAGMRLEALLLHSSGGVRSAMYEWGEKMMAGSGKTRTSRREVDYTLSHLGFSTDAGAYYYYYTGTNDTTFFPSNASRYATYEDLALLVHNCTTALRIPVKYMLLDSYWYFRSTNGGGTKRWEPTPQTFPHGLAWLHEQTGFRWQLHNRYWSSDVDYATQNNGTYEFFIPGSNCSDATGNLNVKDWQNKGCTKPGQFSLPTSADLFEDIMRNATSWGMVTYEQDWMDFESDEVVAKDMDVVAGGDWMSAIGQGAAAANVGVQLCMSHTRHVLAGAQLRHVTQTRASNDYKEMGSDQWDIGRSSLFADALGMAPSKDSYWSSFEQQQPPDGACCGPDCGKCGGPSTGRRDFYSRLNSAVATLSTGPVAYSDRIGSENRAAIMKSCMANGTLLQPDRAATAIDAVFHRMAFTESNRPKPEGVVMATESVVGGQRWGLVLGAELKSAYELPPSAVFSDASLAEEYAVMESNFTRHDSAATIRVVPRAGTFALPVSGKVDFTVHSLAPVSSSGWALLGELSKWVPVSAARFKAVTVKGSDLIAEVAGAEGETVSVSFYRKPGTGAASVVTVDCVLPASGRAKVTGSGSKCHLM